MSGPPVLCCYGGEEAFESYRAEFRRLYLTKPVHDVLGRRVIFPGDSCRHVCFIRDKHDKRDRTRAVWDQERAEHIRWIIVALTDPTEIRWNHQNPRNQSYLLGFPANDPVRPRHRYYVSVEPQGGAKVLFLTAYPIQQVYWDDARNTRGGRCACLYKRPTKRY